MTAPRWILAVLPLVVHGACAGPGKGATEPRDGGLVDTWRVTELDGRPTLADLPPTLHFRPDGQLELSTGVNRGGGSFSTQGASALTIGPLRTTLMARLEPEGAMAQEQAFLEALSEVDGFELRGEELVLYGTGRPLLRCVPGPEPEGGEGTHR
jgi:heat shock protein HslJ